MWNDIFYLDSTPPSGLRWKIKPARNMDAGIVAGTLCSTSGYWVVSYKRKKYSLHRIVWELHYGKAPDDMDVDHIDTDVLNNSIDNLRLATKHQNGWNRAAYKNNKTGVKGLSVRVSKRDACTQWQCQIMTAGKSICKLFPYTEKGKLEAVEWLRATRLSLHGQFANHGGAV